MGVQIWHGNLPAQWQHQPRLPRCGAQGDGGAVEEERCCANSQDEEDEGGEDFLPRRLHHEGWRGEEGLRQRQVSRAVVWVVVRFAGCSRVCAPSEVAIQEGGGGGGVSKGSGLASLLHCCR